MSFIEKRDVFRPTKGEAPFDLNEVFFSRTDDRGVIKAGNFVFRRVANYDWSEVLGAPHKLIRHPDMPKGVFWLLWDTIKRGEYMGAYVKNLARDGLHYWVYAVIAPCDGGYLSARIKPTSKVRDQIEKEYAELLRLEQDEGLSPQDSAKHLQQRIAAMGYENYARFAAHALSEELMARDRGLNKEPDSRNTRFRRMLKAAEELKAETGALVADFEFTRIIPHNMRVIASRLEPNGGPISTLSTNYGSMSRDMSSWFESHVVGPDSNFSTIEGSVAQAMFLECMARILNECSEQMESERRELGDVVLEEERKHLLALVNEYRAKSRMGQTNVGEEAKRIDDACTKMNRFILGLNTTQAMCKIEGARLSGGRESLNDVIRQLDGFQHRVNTNLAKIVELSKTIQVLTG